MPSGAVASWLENAGKKNTTFLLTNPPVGVRPSTERHGNNGGAGVSGLDDGSHAVRERRLVELRRPSLERGRHDAIRNRFEILDRGSQACVGRVVIQHPSERRDGFERPAAA